MTPIQFTATEVAVKGRADLMRQSLDSFKKNLLGVDWQASALFLHADVLGTDDDAREMVSCATETFGTVQPFFGTGNFAKAFKWSMSQPTDEFCFRIEADWELLAPIQIDVLQWILRDNPWLACVNLRAYKSIVDGRLCLSPSLWRTLAAKEIVGRMDDVTNPEFQMRPDPWLGLPNPNGNKQGHWKGVRYPPAFSDNRVVIRDIGRAWMATSGFRKEKDKVFNKWVPA